MSILDHNSQYDIQKIQQGDENAFGKCFWFSGSMKRQKKKHVIVQEEKLTATPVNVELQSTPCEVNISPKIDHEAGCLKNGGTFFKLNGSFEVDNSDLSDDSEEPVLKPSQQQQQQSQENKEEEGDDDGDGGTWFGVSGRHLRAESMANLLMLMDAYQPTTTDDEPQIIPESLNEVMEDNDSYLDDLLKDDISASAPDDREMEKCGNDSTDTLENREHVPDDSTINEKLLEDFDAQFFEIEKLAMESFDDLDLSLPNETKSTKNNKLFGVNSFENEKPTFPNTTKVFDNSVKPKSILSEPHISNPSNVVNNVLMKIPSVEEDEDEAPPKRPTMPTNYTSNHDKYKWKRTDKSPTQYNTNSLPNRKSPSHPHSLDGFKRKSLDDQTITVSTSETGKQEYKLGETIHLRVSVRGSKNHKNQKSLDSEGQDDVFIPNKSKDKVDSKTTSSKDINLPRQNSNDSRNEPRKTKTSRRNKKVEEPSKSVAERISKYESTPELPSPNTVKKQQQQQKPVSTTAFAKPSSQSSSQLVEEDILQEEHVKEDFEMNNEMGVDFINTYLSLSTPDSQDAKSPRPEVEFEHQRSRSMPESMPTTNRPTTSEPPRMLLKRQMQITSSTSSLPTTDGNTSETENKGFESRSEYDSSEDESNQKLTRNRSFRRSIIIEDDEVSVRRKKSVGGTSVSVAFIAINKKAGGCGEAKVTVHQRLKGILNFLDNMVLDDESLGLYYDSVRQLHTVFWDLKSKKDSNTVSGDKEKGEPLSSALNFLVVQEWPKVMLGCFKKLKASYPHVFVQEVLPEVCHCVIL